MNRGDLQTLFDHNYWAHARILEAAAKVTPAQWRAPADAGYGSLLATLTHTLVAEMTLRLRSAGETPPPALAAVKDDLTPAEMTALWQADERAMRAYLAGLTDDDLQQVVRFTTRSGTLIATIRWHFLMQAYTHSAQHRAEAAMLLTAYGQSPGDLDFLIYLRR